MTAPKRTRGRPKGRKFTHFQTIGLTAEQHRETKKAQKISGLKSAPFHREALTLFSRRFLPAKV
jgi:hypothetical protein